MLRSTDILAIGDLARRTGLAVSAIRYYEARGLIAPVRNRGNQRRYARADIRRLAFIQLAQRLGWPLARIAAELARLPEGRAPSREDWRQLSTVMAAGLDARIAALQRTRDRLDGCIGCGCLSLDVCALYNPQDALGADGAGARLLPG